MHSIYCLIMVIFVIFVASGFNFFKSSKQMPKNWYEWKTEIRLQYIGIAGLVQDLWLRDQNHIDLYKQTGRTAVITGGSRGIGLRIIEKLLKCDINVIMGVRDPEKAKMNVMKLINLEKCTGKLICFELDVGNLGSVRKFAKDILIKYNKVDLLINNAGIMCAPFELTVDGYENHFITNYLGHFYLCHLLLPLLMAAGSNLLNSRIINVSSIVNNIGRINYNDINGLKQYYPATAYNQSKLAQVLFTKYLNKLMEDQHAYVQIHAVHPGVVDTDLFQHSSTTALPGLKKLMFKTPEEGSRTVVFAAISKKIEKKGGTYLSNCVVGQTHPGVKNDEECKKFFLFTCDLLNITDFGNRMIEKNDM